MLLLLFCEGVFEKASENIVVFICMQSHFRLCVDRRWNIDDAVSTCAVYESQDEIVASQPIHPAFEADDTGEYEEGVDVYHKLLLSPSSNSIQILPGNFQNKTFSTDSFL